MSLDDQDDVGITPERLEQGRVDRLEKTIRDDEGRISRPYRAFDTLLSLLARGAITPEMWIAGDEFRNQFRVAQLDCIRAADLSRPMVSGGREPELSRKAERARKAVWETMVRLGGHTNLSGSCMWYVVGCEKPVRVWREALGLRITEHTCTGILIGALAIIAEDR